MINKRLKCLVNPTEEEILKREPLLKFSFYLSDKNNILLITLDDIIDKLDRGFGTGSVDSQLVGEASVLTWFWTLGAYEVIRTICQAEDCFDNGFIDKLKKLKEKLAIVRVPSSKMEKKGKIKPVNSNRSPDGWDVERKDLIIGDPENPLSARKLFEQYDETMSSLTINDVIRRHEESIYFDKHNNSQHKKN